MGNKMEKPIISFITPVYNAQEYLSDCIESVLRQTCPAWELILIDDGSQDESGKICDTYASKDSRISVIHKQNTGQLDSRIIGIAKAIGAYCTGLDSDDYLENNCVEVLVNTLNMHPYDIICWNIRQVDNGKEIYRYSMERYGEYSKDEFLKHVSSTANHSFCNKLIRTDIIKQSFYGAIPDSRRSVDYIQICPSICMAHSIFAIDDVLYNYRQISSSVTHVADGRHIIDVLDSTKCVFDIVEHYGVIPSEFKDIECSNLINNIGFQLKRAIKCRSLDKKDIEIIRNHSIYKMLCKYENCKIVTWDLLIMLKLFRHRAELILYYWYTK